MDLAARVLRPVPTIRGSAPRRSYTRAVVAAGQWHKFPRYLPPRPIPQLLLQSTEVLPRGGSEQAPKVGKSLLLPTGPTVFGSDCGETLARGHC